MRTFTTPPCLRTTSYYISIFFLLLTGCTATKKAKEIPSNHFPLTVEKPTVLPPKDNFYIYLLAGQSNMAGRGFVEPVDTLASSHVLTLNKNKEWVLAKEPLHYYEPLRTGLDCGLSFGKKLSALYGKEITIGLVPCAIGGSSIEQWLGDSTYRDITLYSNLIKNARIAMQYGTIKGILWHQGESNSSGVTYKNFLQNLNSFFTKLRNDLGNTTLPIYAGELASFINKSTNKFVDSVNSDLYQLSRSDKNIYVIKTSDLTHRGDTLHFDSRSLRLMGERFAKKVYTSR